MLTEQQIAERLTGIGSSDSSAVLGVNPYRTADDVFKEKLGLAPPFEGNEATYFGDLLEPLLRKEYEKRSGVPVREVKNVYRHPQHKHVIAHIDGLILTPGRDGVLEIKCMRYPPKDMDSHYHFCQLQHALLATGCLWGVIAPLFGGNEFHHDKFVYERDEEFLAAMLHIYDMFWTKVLNARKEIAA